MSEPTQRRTTSELDIRSLRRISDALLLAQNRARRATDRANQTEHVLRLVLAQVDVPRLRVDSLDEWEMLRGAVRTNPLLLLTSPRRRNSSFGDTFVHEDAASVTSSLPTTFAFEDAAKDVVASLNAAVIRHKRFVKQLTLPPLQSHRWSQGGGFFDTVQFVAGLLAGVAIGVLMTKQWQLQLKYTREETPSLFGRLARWCSWRAPARGTPWHLIPMPIDEYSYLMHPATFEVV